MFRRNGVYYLHNNATGVQRSLGTKDKEQAKRLFAAENHAKQETALNLELGKVYLRGADPKLATRVWQEVMDELSSHGKPASQARCKREMDSPAFSVIRNKLLVETTGDDLRAVLNKGGSAANNYLRRLHNLALGNGWIFAPIIPAKQWPKPEKTPKRAITFAEHCRIIAAEQNEERRHYYEFLWLIGAAQTDGAMMTAENVNWQNHVLTYFRQKTGQPCFLRIGTELETLLRSLPAQGFLFPSMAALRDKDRSAEFCRRCRLLKITGVSLHSYRYSWAERAFKAGYAERFAQAALGHSSSAVHYGYAKNAEVICPPLENPADKIIPLDAPIGTGEENRKTA